LKPDTLNPKPQIHNTKGKRWENGGKATWFQHPSEIPKTQNTKT